MSDATADQSYEQFKTLLISLVKKYSNHDDLDVSEDMALEDLGIDSIDLIEITFEVEEQTGREVSEESVLGMENFGALCRQMFEADGQQASGS